MITCGVDIGARTIGIVLYNGEQISGEIVKETGVYPKENALKAFNALLESKQIPEKDIKKIISTGYGRNFFERSDAVASEIICQANGVRYLFPDVYTIIDIGGQDSKVVHLGSNGRVIDFQMNDRCAAGTGKFIEMVANTLNIPLEETGNMAVNSTGMCEISSMCAVFAESEIVGLIHKSIRREVILRGVFRSIAKRINGMAGLYGIKEPMVFTGGVAKNPGVIEALKEVTGKNEILIPENPQITGALGASIIAFQRVKQN